MVEVSAVSFKATIDTSSLRGEVNRVNQALANQSLKLRVQLDPAGLRTDINNLTRSLTDSQRSIKLKVQLDPAGLKAQVAAISRELQGSAIRLPVAPVTSRAPAAGGGGTAATRAIDPGAALSREFDKTAAAVEKLVNRAAQINFRKQEQEAAALARELQKTERAAAQAQAQAQRISFGKQQQEVAAFAREFDKAAAAQQRLQQQSARDSQVLGGAKFSDREIKSVEASIAKVRAETQKADQVAALLREKYKLTDEEVKKIQGSLGGVTQEQGRFNAAIAGLASAASFAAIQATIQALQAAVAGIVGTFQKASESFREFEANILSFQAKSQGVEVDIAGLADEIDRVAKITSQSPGSLSAAASNLVSLGVAAEDVEGRLDGLAKAADVLQEDPVILGRVFQGALTAYEQYGVGIEEVSDIVSQAINTTAIGARSGAVELEQLFSKAAAPAATLGATLEELVTLDALFAGAGARPEARATAVETLLTRIASQKDKLEQEGVEIAIKENGGLDVEGTLRNIQGRLEQIPDTAGRLSLLRNFFGESAGNDILTAVSRLDASYADIQTNIEGANGAIQRSFDIVSQGTDFQAGVVEGGFEAAFKTLGETLNPIEKGFIALQQAIIETANVDLSGLASSAEELGKVLGENPELANDLAAAFSEIAQVVVGGLSSAISSLADGLRDLPPDAIKDVGESFTNVIEIAGSLVGNILQVSAAFGGLGLSIGSGVLSVFSELTPIISLTADVLVAMANAVKPLTDNSFILEAALQAVLLRMVAIQGLAFAGFLKSVGAAILSGLAVPAISAATGLGTLQAALVATSAKLATFLGVAAAAAAPLAVVAAGIAAIKFVRFTKDLGDAQDALESYIGSVETSADVAFNFANRIKGINDAIAAQGGTATDEQLRKLTEYKRLAQEQVDDLQRQLSEVQSFTPQNESQTNAQQGLVDQLEITIGALEGQLGKAETTLAEAGEKAGQAAVEGVGEGLAGGPQFNVRQEELGAESALKRFRDEQANLLRGIEQADSEAQINLTATGADPAAFIDQERKTLADRVKVRETFIDQIQALQKRPGITVAEGLALETALAEAEKELAADRLSVQQNFQKSRAEVLRQASQEQQQALADIERESSAVAASIAEQNLGPRDAAAAQAASEQDALRARLENRRTFLAELQALEAEGGLSAEQALEIGNQIVQAETEINNDRAALATSLEEERQRVLQQSLDDQLAALQIFRDREAQVLESRKTELDGQLSIIAADNQVTVAGDNAAAADLGLERDRLETIRQQALAVGDVAAARQADRDIAALGQQALEQQSAAQQRQFAVKRQQLTIELQIARIDAQRQALIANIAVKEAELNIQKAIGAKASQEEIDNLRQQLALRQDIADDAANGIQVTERVFESRFEEIGIEEQISQTEQLQAVEDQRQENLSKAKEIVDQEIEAKQRLLSAERALVDAERARASALISALNAQRATTEEAQEQLKAIRERFREAQGAGLFQGLGGEFERAASQLQGILASGGQLRDLVQFAQGTDDAIARQLLGGVGRGDVISLLDAEEQGEQVANAQAEAEAARAAADQILIDEIANAGEPLLIAFRQGGAEAAGLIQQALSFVSPNGSPVQSLRVGGVVDGAPGGMAPVQLHRDEFAFAPVGTRVVSQAESRRLVQEHLAATMPNIGPMVAPTLSLPDFGGASTRAAIAQNMPSAAQLNAKGLEKRFDELIEIVQRNATRKDGGQTNYFQTGSQSEASRLAAELRRLSRRSPGGLY